MNLRVVSFLGEPEIRTIVVGEGAALFLLAGRPRRAALLVASVGGAGLLTVLVKQVVDRRRPRHLLGRLHDSSSFPSGHAAGTAALTASISVMVWRATRNALLTGGLSLLGALWTGLEGYSRVRLHQHHPGDVFAGLAVGYLSAGLAARAIHPDTDDRVSDG